MAKMIKFYPDFLQTAFLLDRLAIL